MPDLCSNSALITRHIQSLRGGSRPILAEASDGFLYVIKFTNNQQGANLCFNESVGSELYRACGLPSPMWKPLLVTDVFLDQNQDCWMDTPYGRIRPASGLCFGSRFLGGAGTRLLEVLPGTYFKRVRNHENFWLAWLIDICAGHADNRQAIFREDSDRWLNASFIDHGHLLGGPKGDLQPHYIASRYLDPRIYQSGVCSEHLVGFQRVALRLNFDQFWRRMQTLPDDWKTASAYDSLAQCLTRLSNRELLQNIADTMIDALQRANGFERNNWQNERRPAVSVLCPRIQATGLEHRLIAGGISHPACA